MVKSFDEDKTKLSDKEFITWVYHNFQRLMYYTARKFLSNSSQCEDVVQESLARLIEKTQTLRSLTEFALVNYIIVTVKNVSLNYLKKQALEQKLFDNASEVMVNLQSRTLLPDEAVIFKEKKERLASALLAIDEESRLLLEGKYFLRYDDNTLASIIGCSPESIRMKLTRARRKALKLLEEGE